MEKIKRNTSLTVKEKSPYNDINTYEEKGAGRVRTVNLLKKLRVDSLVSEAKNTTTN